MKLTHQQKLEALSYRFYQHGTWTPAAGDFYTTSRADLELYQIVAIESGLVTTRYTEGTETISSWPESEFITGGFGPKRVFVPPWVMSMETGDAPAGNERSPSQQNRMDALINLEEVRKAVFGDVGDEPNVYADYDQCSELAGKMRKAIVELTPSPQSQVVGVAERCAERFDRIASIIDRNLYHQAEKVEDAKSIAISMREELRHGRSAAGLAITPEQKELILLSIIKASGGNCDSSESQWNWINWFCNDEADRDGTDTFNRCNDKGWLRTTHNSDWDSSTSTLTDAGVAHLALTTEGQPNG